MGVYIVKTKEDAEGQYIVQAEDENDVRKKLGYPGTDWDHVHQIDLMVYGREIREITDVTPS